jgi:hypothetical protein
MVPSWYAPNVAFTDPLTSLVGVESYRNNVNMLAGRTMLGQVLFTDASIILHSVTGGDVTTEKKEGERISIDNIVTRWTLRVTVQILPWKPIAIFSGVSIYTLQPGGDEGVLISCQQDYWDSINIKQLSSSAAAPTAAAERVSIPIPIREQYHKVDKIIALQDFLGQLKPDGFRAAAAAPELPYLLLRRGNGYEIRRYPTYIGIETTYDRRDVGYGVLGAFAGNNMGPLAPSIMKVYDDDDERSTPKEKQMTWPLRYATVGDEDFLSQVPEDAIAKAGTGQWKSVSLPIKPGRVVAVRTFEDAAIGPAVRAADRELRSLLLRDGGIGGTLVPAIESKDYVEFAQYDAIHSMGKRRTEVWIELSIHPF